MYKTTASIEGMACGMCETHINEIVRKTFKVKKVSSSFKKGLCEIISEEVPEEEKLKAAVGGLGYEVKSVSTEPYEKKGLFSRK